MPHHKEVSAEVVVLVKVRHQLYRNLGVLAGARQGVPARVLIKALVEAQLEVRAEAHLEPILKGMPVQALLRPLLEEVPAGAIQESHPRGHLVEAQDKSAGEAVQVRYALVEV